MGQNVSAVTHRVAGTLLATGQQIPPIDNSALARQCRDAVHRALDEMNARFRDVMDAADQQGHAEVQPGGRLFVFRRLLPYDGTVANGDWIWQYAIDPASVCVKHSSSASDTQMFTASIMGAAQAQAQTQCGPSMSVSYGKQLCQGSDVFGKMYVIDDVRQPTMCLDQLAETALYKYVTLLVANRVCPHFVILQGEAHGCDIRPWMRAPTPDCLQLGRHDTALNRAYPNPDPATTKLGLMLTEAHDARVTITLGQFINLHMSERNPEVDDDAMRHVLWQLFYTVDVMSQFGLVHGDLHFGNALVTMLPTRETFSYVVTNADGQRQMVSFQTRFMLRIYDWDRASKQASSLDALVIPNFACPSVAIGARMCIGAHNIVVAPDANTDKYAVMAGLPDDVMDALDISCHATHDLNSVAMLTQPVENVGDPNASVHRRYRQIFLPSVILHGVPNNPFASAADVNVMSEACSEVVRAFHCVMDRLAVQLGAYKPFANDVVDFRIRSVPDTIVWMTPDLRRRYNRVRDASDRSTRCLAPSAAAVAPQVVAGPTPVATVVVASHNNNNDDDWMQFLAANYGPAAIDPDASMRLEASMRGGGGLSALPSFVAPFAAN